MGNENNQVGILIGISFIFSNIITQSAVNMEYIRVCYWSNKGLIKVDLEFNSLIPGLYQTWNSNKPGFKKLNSRSELGFEKLNSRLELDLSKKAIIK